MHSIITLLLSSLISLAAAESFAPLMVPKDETLMIPDKYIVVFKDDPFSEVVSSQSTSRVNHAVWLQSRIADHIGSGTGNKLEHSFNLKGMSGYSGYFSPEIIDEIRKRDEVKYVEADQLMYAMNMKMKNKKKSMKEAMKEFRGSMKAMKSKRGSPKMISFLKLKESRKLKNIQEAASTLMTQSDAPWGLNRLSKELASESELGDREDENNTGKGGYRYPSSAGENIDVYVIDTGINIEHEEFEGRARWGKTIPLFDLDIDGNGHGTHCAGTIGSNAYGVAKKANLIAVKVLRTSGFGTNSDVIKGVEWVIKQNRKNSKKGRQAVANMSLGGGRSVTLENVVDKAVESGVHFSVAAGNDAEDACDYSPAAADGPVTVGASTSVDAMAYFSNHGKCVDLFAPGLNITSTWIGGKDAVNTISGTSMASPHVAGVMALYLGERNWTPKELKDELILRSKKGLIASVPLNTPNLLINTVHLLSEMKN